MVHPSTLVPVPQPHHATLLAQISAGIESRIAAGAGRGLVVVQMLEKAGQYRVGFTPARSVDLPHVMAMEVPEEIATEVVRAVAEYDDLATVPVLMTERQASGKVLVSFLNLDVRPVGTSGAKETVH